jgi:hypothetical protein
MCGGVAVRRTGRARGQPAGRACIRSTWTASKSRAAGSSSAIRALPTDVNCVRTDGCPRDRARPGREYTGGCGTGRQALRRRVRWHTAWYPAARYPARHGRRVPESTHAEPSRQAVPRACRQSPRTPPPPPTPHPTPPPPLLPLPLKCMPPSTIANMGCQAADERTQGKERRISQNGRTKRPDLPSRRARLRYDRHWRTRLDVACASEACLLPTAAVRMHARRCRSAVMRRRDRHATKRLRGMQSSMRRRRVAAGSAALMPNPSALHAILARSVITPAVGAARVGGVRSTPSRACR